MFLFKSDTLYAIDYNAAIKKQYIKKNLQRNATYIYMSRYQLPRNKTFRWLCPCSHKGAQNKRKSAANPDILILL